MRWLDDVLTDSNQAFFLFVAQINDDVFAVQALGESLLFIATLWRFLLSTISLVLLHCLLDTLERVINLGLVCELKLQLIGVFESLARSAEQTANQSFQLRAALFQFTLQVSLLLL
jgi:hypothetical protein